MILQITKEAYKCSTFVAKLTLPSLDRESQIGEREDAGKGASDESL